ncbi:MAG TPA: hypothetical protein VGK00_08300 [Anaerolineales bacterium]|jgi:hypothetical protein
MLGNLQIDLLTGIFSFLITVLILSYLVGDNPAFRIAIHAFVGVSAGYIAVVIFRQVIVDKLFLPFATGSMFERTLLAFPLVMSLLLLGKSSARFEWLGRPVVALVVGVGTASAVAGAILGTLFPQVVTATNMFSPEKGTLVAGVVALLGTIITLAYFQFTILGKKTAGNMSGLVMKFISVLGQVFIAITLGAIFAGVLSAALTALVDRVQSLVLFVNQILLQFIP